MAIIAFWGGNKKESGQTLSISAIATHMAIEHNYRILLIDAVFDDDTMERCFWNINDKSENIKKVLNKGKLDIASGAEGLTSALSSNKATPEIISNYTRVVFKNRLDVLCGLITKDRKEYQKSIGLYVDLIKTADKYYDMVFIDVEKTLEESTVRYLLEASKIIVYSFTKNLKQANDYLAFMEKNKDLLKKDKVIPLLSNSDENVVYNVKNVTRYISEKGEIATIPYNSTFVKSASEAGVTQFFLKTRVSGKENDKNSQFVEAVEHACKKIIDRLQELKYKA